MAWLVTLLWFCGGLLALVIAVEEGMSRWPRRVIVALWPLMALLIAAFALWEWADDHLSPAPAPDTRNEGE